LIPEVGRVLGFDLGSARVGVAISDTHQRVATSLRVVSRPANLALIVAEEEAVGAVIGLPLSLNGGVGPAAAAVLDEVEALAPVLGVPLETVDERFSTVTASQALRAGGHRGRHARLQVDATAAAVFLQSWLDRRRVAV
jgi:putative Holliday junction resolvase